MKQKNIETYFYSTVGIVVMFIVLLAFYVVTSAAKQRVDLTSERAFTLAPGTKRIINKIGGRVTIRFYCTQGNLMPPSLRTYAQHVEDLLGEYQQASHGKIVVQKFDPQPDSDAEDSARLDGIEGQTVPGYGGDRVYMGLSVSSSPDKRDTIGWLAPDHERLLEYDISRAITHVLNKKQSVIGLMSAMPVFGMQSNPMMQRMGQGGSEPFMFLSELQKDYTVREVPMTATKIDDDINELIVYEPRDISESTQYALDQFVLRGGRLLAFVDPHAYFDQKHDSMAQVLGESSAQSSLPTLFKAWGLDMDVNKVVADLSFAGKNPNTASTMPCVLIVTKEGINGDDVVTSQMDNLVFPFAGAITGKPVAGLTETVLVHSSGQSELVEGMTASVGGDEIVKNFHASNTQFPLALRLTGKFKTAFPDGAPKPGPTEEGKDKPKDAAKGPQLKEATAEGTVVLVADTDLLADQVCVQVQNFMGYKLLRRLNGNLDFMQSLVDQLAGDSDLITLRSRASLNRPFTRLKEMEAKAGSEWEAKIRDIESKRSEVEQKISALQQAKSGADSKMILSPEQQKELASYQETVTKANKDLRNLQKQLRRDTDALEFHTKVINIAAMPALVALTGIVLAIFKRNRTAAK